MIRYPFFRKLPNTLLFRPREGAVAQRFDLHPDQEGAVRAGKQPVGKEKGTVGKHRIQETKMVRGAVRGEGVRVERKGDAE